MKIHIYDLWTLELYFLVANSKARLFRDKLVTSVKNNFINATKLPSPADVALDSGLRSESIGDISDVLWDPRRHSLMNIIKNSYCDYIQESFETETKVKVNANNADLERSHLMIMESLLKKHEAEKERT